MSKRADIASALLAVLSEIADFLTIRIVSNIDRKFPFDLMQAELPAIKVAFSDESYDYHPARMTMAKISADFYLYSLEWDKDSTLAEETLLKAFRDKLGTKLTLENTCVDISIRTIIKMEMEYPLVLYKVNAVILYESSIENL